MEYPKEIMTIPELKKMGFTRTYLDRAFRSNSNDFATRVTPGKSKSPIMFDTAKFEAWRQREIRAQKGGRG